MKPPSSENQGEFEVSLPRVADLVSRVVSKSDLRDVGWTILDEMSELGATGGHIYLVTEDKRGLELLTARNIPSPLLEYLRQVGFGASLMAAIAARSRQVERLSMLDADIRAGLTNADQVLNATDSGEMLSVPLLLKGRLLGVLTLTFRDEDSLQPQHMAVIQACCEIFTSAVDKRASA